MKKIITIFVVSMLVFTMAIPAFAAENEGVIPRNADNSCLVSSANPTDSFYMDETVYANRTSIRVDLIKDSNYTGDGIITLRFYNSDTERYYSLAFEANRIGVYYKTVGYTLPEGRYTVEIAYTPCYINQLAINFH